MQKTFASALIATLALADQSLETLRALSQSRKGEI